MSSLETVKRRREDNNRTGLGQTILGKGSGSFGCGYWLAIFHAEINTSAK